MPRRPGSTRRPIRYTKINAPRVVVMVVEIAVYRLEYLAAVQSIIDQMVVYAPVPSQVYKRNVEPGEYVSPGVPLVTLIDLNDLWVHFDLREDLIKTLKVGDRFAVRIPALADRRITVEVRLIATKGEYASWRATRATGDFDLRTFSIRAYPVEKVPEMRPGMSAYVDWQQRQ
jgi:HlyD family secretion protein